MDGSSISSSFAVESLTAAELTLYFTNVHLWSRSETAAIQSRNYIYLLHSKGNSTIFHVAMAGAQGRDSGYQLQMHSMDQLRKPSGELTQCFGWTTRRSCVQLRSENTCTGTYSAAPSIPSGVAYVRWHSRRMSTSAKECTFSSINDLHSFASKSVSIIVQIPRFSS